MNIAIIINYWFDVVFNFASVILYHDSYAIYDSLLWIICKMQTLSVETVAKYTLFFWLFIFRINFASEWATFNSSLSIRYSQCLFGIRSECDDICHTVVVLWSLYRDTHIDHLLGNRNIKCAHKQISCSMYTIHDTRYTVHHGRKTIVFSSIWVHREWNENSIRKRNKTRIQQYSIELLV